MDEEKRYDPQENLPVIRAWEVLQPPVSGTMDEARLCLQEKIRVGTTCPLCGQHAQLYCRTLDHSMVRVLVCMYNHYVEHGPKWVHLPSLLVEEPDLNGKERAAMNGVACKLGYWGLLDRKASDRRDPSSPTGMYRITKRGILFVQLKIKVPLHVFIYNKKQLRFGEPMVDAREASRNKFDYDKTVRGLGTL